MWRKCTVRNRAAEADKGELASSNSNAVVTYPAPAWMTERAVSGRATPPRRQSAPVPC